MATKPKTNLPINYQAQFEAEAAAIQKRIAAPAGDRIRFNSNRAFITPDGLEGETLEVVIVDFVSANLYYDGPFDRDNPQPPGCFAIGPEPSTLTPSTNSPNQQSSACATCPNNQFGSAPNGKGKACKNTRLIAVIPASALDDENGEAPLWIMSVPPTSLKAFDTYVHSLANRLRTVPVGVITQITLDPGNTFASPRFTVVRPLDPKEVGTFISRREEAQKRLSDEPDVSQYQAPAKPANRAVPARRR